MKISEVRLIGFRNFKDATISFEEKSLIIGANDIGKSNLLYALRIILDKSLSENDLEAKDSDFYVHEETENLSITIKFENVTEDCLISKFRENVDESGTLYISYQAQRNLQLKSKPVHKFLIGRNIDSLQEIQGRFYLKVLNLKYIPSNRDLFSYVKKERKNLIQESKILRSEDELENDDKVLNKLDKSLEIIHKRLTKLTYVNSATNNINKELKELSFHNENQNVIFDIGASDASQFVDNLELVSRVNSKNLIIGGDGRNNQIFLALWAARNEIKEDPPLEICIYCIEEPECHLHPHQQRKLASYLSNILKGQVIITTHSPQIACEFSPKSIIRLYNNEPDTLAACNGCNTAIEDAFIQFGHRLNIIPAEAFFANVVLLVEGVSEVLFYKALSATLGIDLDRLNISILMVDGVGFQTYIDLLCTLNIDFIVRTDNDIFKIPHTSNFRYAGVQRCVDMYKKNMDYFIGKYQIGDSINTLLGQENLLTGFPTKTPPIANKQYSDTLRVALETIGIYLADKDLESDLKNSEMCSKVSEFFVNTEDDDLIEAMQKQKGVFMYEFLSKYSSDLVALRDSGLAKPLIKCKSIVGEAHE